MSTVARIDAERFPPFDPATSGRFSDWLRSSAGPTWQQALDHRFFREVAADQVEDDVFERYLRIEYGFVDCAAIVLGYAVAKAPSFVERRKLAVGLYGLVTDQQAYFVKAFDRMQTPAASRSGLAPAGSFAGLHELFLSTARLKGYEEILCCILAAEWMYLTWCRRAHRTTSGRGYIRDWVALHAGGAFERHVTWTRGEIDVRGPFLPPAMQSGMRALFDSVLTAEIAFHDAAYGPSDKPLRSADI